MENNEKNSELTKYKIICLALTIIILVSIIDRIIPFERNTTTVIKHYDANGKLTHTDTTYFEYD